MTDLKPEDLVKLRERLLAFEDMINMPPTTSRDEPPELRDYRHRIYREWEKLCADTLSLLADTYCDHQAPIPPPGPPCPDCGEPTVEGFGLAGGGYGAYEYCEAEGCGYFHKHPEMSEDWE